MNNYEWNELARIDTDEEYWQLKPFRYVGRIKNVILNKRLFLSPHQYFFILWDAYGMEYLFLANSSSGERGHTTRWRLGYLSDFGKECNAIGKFNSIESNSEVANEGGKYVAEATKRKRIMDMKAFMRQERTGKGIESQRTKIIFFTNNLGDLVPAVHKHDTPGFLRDKQA